MAYKILCDVTACGAVIAEAATGQPTLPGRQAVYCDRCQGYIASVDREMEREATKRGFALIEELDALRREKLAQALPQQLGGAGLSAEWRIEVPE